MDKKAITVLDRFLRKVDEREFIYNGRGKLIIRSIGNGCAEVIVTLSRIGDRVGSLSSGVCSSARELYDGIRSGLDNLCDKVDVEGDFAALIDLLRRKTKP